MHQRHCPPSQLVMHAPSSSTPPPATCNQCRIHACPPARLHTRDLTTGARIKLMTIQPLFGAPESLRACELLPKITHGGQSVGRPGLPAGSTVTGGEPSQQVRCSGQDARAGPQSRRQKVRQRRCAGTSLVPRLVAGRRVLAHRLGKVYSTTTVRNQSPPFPPGGNYIYHIINVP